MLNTNAEIKKRFHRILSNSLNTVQVNELGTQLDKTFNVYKESGFGSTMPLPRQTAADTLLDYFNSDEEIVHLFTIMLRNEGERFGNAKLNIWRRDEFINLLLKYKWIYDDDLMRFFLDPFYENELNFLKDIRVIDLRYELPIDDIIKGITELSKKMSVKDLDWRVTIRLYDLDQKIGELIRKIIELLLVPQNLQKYIFELFTCLKELAINSSKANYKLLFEKFITRPQGITANKNYFHFLRLFKSEIEEHGNKRLIELAKKEDKFITITFQSSRESLEIWVTNNENISAVEKQEILKKLGRVEWHDKPVGEDDEELTEGAGLGLSIILSILKKYSHDKDPLKVIFYHEFVKIGFSLKRDELLENLS